MPAAKKAAAKKVVSQTVNSQPPVPPVAPVEEPVVAGPKVIRVTKAWDIEHNDIVVEPQKLKNTRGEDVPVENYFYAKEGQEAIAPNFFNRAVGFPSDDPDIIAIFDKVFDPADNFVLLKRRGAEVYSVLVPLKFANRVSAEADSILGEYQTHSISFANEGGLNIDNLAARFRDIATNLGYVRSK